MSRVHHPPSPYLSITNSRILGRSFWWCATSPIVDLWVIEIKLRRRYCLHALLWKTGPTTCSARLTHRSRHWLLSSCSGKRVTSPRTTSLHNSFLARDKRSLHPSIRLMSAWRYLVTVCVRGALGLCSLFEEEGPLGFALSAMLDCSIVHSEVATLTLTTIYLNSVISREGFGLPLRSAKQSRRSPAWNYVKTISLNMWMAMMILTVYSRSLFGPHPLSMITQSTPEGCGSVSWMKIGIGVFMSISKR